MATLLATTAVRPASAPSAAARRDALKVVRRAEHVAACLETARLRARMEQRLAQRLVRKG